MRLILQAVEEFFSTLEYCLWKTPEYIEENILARITEPERVISFRVLGLTVMEKFKLTVVTVFNSTQLLDHIRRTSFPPNCKPRDLEIPRIRTNL